MKRNLNLQGSLRVERLWPNERVLTAGARCAAQRMPHQARGVLVLTTYYYVPDAAAGATGGVRVRAAARYARNGAWWAAWAGSLSIAKRGIFTVK